MQNPGHTVWRDDVVEGVPGSGKHSVSKLEVRAWAAELEAFGHLLGHQIFYESGTWTRPDGCTAIYVEALGGGGSGASCGAAASAQVECGSGGGGGGFSASLIRSPPSSVAVTVGLGGAKPPAGSNPGNSGGTSDFGTTENGGLPYVRATGGEGGHVLASTAEGCLEGGAGGNAGGVIGDIKVSGDSGGFAIVSRTPPATIGISGRGGSGAGPYGGAGGKEALSIGPGHGGGVYGGGGGGAFAWNLSDAAQAGPGSHGLVVVWMFGGEVTSS